MRVLGVVVGGSFLLASLSVWNLDVFSNYEISSRLRQKSGASETRSYFLLPTYYILLHRAPNSSLLTPNFPTGERTIGFYDKHAHTLRFAELVRTDADISRFFQNYGLKRPDKIAGEF